ncbi:hypothetical protein PoB_004099400 [Plakobranchus ocellatus]|uniref:Uncharacterized protein n=1 Tax=Plakobranchus ocellatus TaxID=259542 RepID=A0AAV4B812_9GAST|nr:hypothetical protein PoB_004099400 [Plakobranchus ocellatus]
MVSFSNFHNHSEFFSHFPSNTCISSIFCCSGTLGGQMGLFLGASILSVTELVEVLLLLMLKAAKRCASCAASQETTVEPSEDQSQQKENNQTDSQT